MVREQFQELRDIEKQILNTELKRVSLNVENIAKKTDLVFKSKFPGKNQKEHYPEIYLVPKELNILLNQIPLEIKPFSAGIYFGFIKKGEFRLSIEGMDFLYRQKLITKTHQLITSSEGEKAILYGNEIRKYMVNSYPVSRKKNHILAVLNKYQEVIAIANPIVDFNEWNLLENNKLVAHNLVDKGYYLRSAQ
ncbi:MAG: hypothetical protein ACOC44_04285 [Promethearchaeia archaeon]